MELPAVTYRNRRDAEGLLLCWDKKAVFELLRPKPSIRTIERTLNDFLPDPIDPSTIQDKNGQPINKLIYESLESEAKRKRYPSLVVQCIESSHGKLLMIGDVGVDGYGWKVKIWLRNSNVSRCAGPTLCSAVIGLAPR